MTLDNLTTAARAAGFALAGDPQDPVESDLQRAPLRLPSPIVKFEAKAVAEIAWLRDWFAPKVARLTA
jgi:hypothetical protein